MSIDPPPGVARAANVDEAEVARFSALASRWWDPDGEFRPLHQLNPVRTEYIAGRVRIAGAKVVDVGCGGGLLSESLAARGAHVFGIDASEEALAAAREHLDGSGLDVEYHAATAEALAQSMPGRFDLVTCMELIEHVPDGAALVYACARLARPGRNGRVLDHQPHPEGLRVRNRRRRVRPGHAPAGHARLRPLRPAVGARAVGPSSRTCGCGT